jgi:hypothetical protein
MPSISQMFLVDVNQPVHPFDPFEIVESDKSVVPSHRDNECGGGKWTKRTILFKVLGFLLL